MWRKLLVKLGVPMRTIVNINNDPDRPGDLQSYVITLRSYLRLRRECKLLPDSRGMVHVVLDNGAGTVIDCRNISHFSYTHVYLEESLLTLYNSQSVRNSFIGIRYTHSLANQ